MSKPHYEVVAAVIENNNKVLCCKRGPSKDGKEDECANKWEFPGGKIEEGESHEEALIREIKEELNCLIKVNKYITTINHDYANKDITLHIYLCELVSGEPKLTEHVDYKWCNNEELLNIELSEADSKALSDLNSILSGNAIGKYNIFLCYRDEGAILAKNFKLYADSISRDPSDERNFGRIWYSDLESRGYYLNEKLMNEIISGASYFIFFVTKGFTKGFINKDKTINKNCATALEVYLAEKARRNKNLKFMFIDINDGKLSKKDLNNIRQLFELKGILKNDTMSNYVGYNTNKHNIRQHIDNALYDRLLKDINSDRKTYKIVEFGKYPKSKINDPIICNILNNMIGDKPTIDNLNGWNSFNYFYDGKQSNLFLYKDIIYEDSKYRGIISFALRPFLTTFKKSYLNKIKYEKNRIYWFKYENIKWKVLNEHNGYEFLLSDEVLDSQPINYTVNDVNGIHANNYEHSSVRKWLNEEFYNWSFSNEEKNSIIDCTDTIITSKDSINDNVFLASKEEIETYVMQLSNRCLKSTDYAKYQGVYETKYPDWFLRTNYEDSDTDIYFVNGEDGSIKEDLVIYTNGGIVPCIIRKK